jgi:hypothetical protein
VRTGPIGPVQTDRSGIRDVSTHPSTRRPCYTGAMRPPDDPPDPEHDDDEQLGVADDGMAPLINNTGADGADGDDADASSG